MWPPVTVSTYSHSSGRSADKARPCCGATAADWRGAEVSFTAHWHNALVDILQECHDDSCMYAGRHRYQRALVLC